jgi:hypothetical protein
MVCGHNEALGITDPLGQLLMSEIHTQNRLYCIV